MTKKVTEKLEPQAPAEQEQPNFRKLARTILPVLGVVYGDLGTNVLFTLKTAFSEREGLEISSLNVLGLVSLIFWSLIIVVSIKYVTYIMNADNRGEGGVIALVAQVHPRGRPKTIRRWLLVMVGLFGATILYGDCTVTGAISVLSAVEGLDVAATGMESYVVPITVIILIFLYLLQRQGSRVVGFAFGPIMLIWFATLALLGISGIIHNPVILTALNPAHGFEFFVHNGWQGFLLLGIVFLSVAGAEALFTDIGHFGKTPIRIGWLFVVLPCLVCHYFGQGAFLLDNPGAASNPFYKMAPSWALYPLLVLATLATLIASQAVISGSFAITRQAVLLGFLPRLKIEHTSEEHPGQVYISSINWILAICTIGLVIGFQKSTNLANAYGVPVSITMIVTTILASVIVFERWKWPKWTAIALATFFLIPDTAFFLANLTKVAKGGWFPLLVGGIAFIITTTWRRGRILLREIFKEELVPVDEYLREFLKHPPHRIEGTAIYLTGNIEGMPGSFLSQVEHFQVFHERVILFTLEVEGIPYVEGKDSIEKVDLGQGFYRITSHHGFMEERDMREIFKLLRSRNIMDIEMEDTSFIMGEANVTPKGFKMNAVRSRIFAYLERNSVPITDFINIPPKRVIELGVYVDF